MPSNNFPGGNSIFPTTIRPSIFNPLPASEMLTRKGEKFIWIRALPAPSNSQGGRLALPDDNKGFIYTFEKIQNVPEEAVPISAIDGNRISVRYSRIARVNRIWIFLDDTAGGLRELTPIGFNDNLIIIEETDLNYWSNVFVDYDYYMYDEKYNYTDILLNDTDKIELSIERNKIIIRVHEFWIKSPGESTWEEIQIKHSLKTIQLDKVRQKGTEVIAKIDLYSPVDLVYKTINLKDVSETNLPVGAQEGDLEILVSESVKLSKGDLLISTVSYGVEKEISEYVPGKGFPLKRNPVLEVSQVFSFEKEYLFNEFKLIDRQYIELEEKPGSMPKQISIVYTYNPTFRVGSSQEYSGLSGKTQLRQYVAKPDSTNIILHKIK